CALTAVRLHARRRSLPTRRSSDLGLTATVRLDPGQLVRIDSVVVRGTARTNMRYLQAHIGIRPGDLYNESLIQAAERRVRELPLDRKSTRLNSSHVKISYAVFCLK